MISPAESTTAQRTPEVPKSKPNAQASPVIGPSARAGAGVMLAPAAVATSIATVNVGIGPDRDLARRFSRYICCRQNQTIRTHEPSYLSLATSLAHLLIYALTP